VTAEYQEPFTDDVSDGDPVGVDGLVASSTLSKVILGRVRATDF
jgi:hypothetical protein